MAVTDYVGAFAFAKWQPPATLLPSLIPVMPQDVYHHVDWILVELPKGLAATPNITPALTADPAVLAGGTMSGKVLGIGLDNLLQLNNLQAMSGGDDATPTATLTATVTCTITDKNSSTVATVTLDPVAGSNGDYEGIAADTLSLTDGDPYTLTFAADDGADRQYKAIMLNVIARDPNI